LTTARASRERLPMICFEELMLIDYRLSTARKRSFAGHLKLNQIIGERVLRFVSIKTFTVRMTSRCVGLDSACDPESG